MTEEAPENDGAAADRARTMQVRALRRLSQTEVAGLGIGLAAIVEVETELIGQLSGMRHAAEKEAYARNLRGLPGLGPYGTAFVEIKRALARLGLAREDTETAIDLGKVERRV